MRADGANYCFGRVSQDLKTIPFEGGEYITEIIGQTGDTGATTVINQVQINLSIYKYFGFFLLKTSFL